MKVGRLAVVIAGSALGVAGEDAADAHVAAFCVVHADSPHCEGCAFDIESFGAAARLSVRHAPADDSGAVRKFVNIFANDEDIRFLKGLDTPIKETDEVSIVPAIAGG